MVANGSMPASICEALNLKNHIPHIVADVGGTNARFALTRPGIAEVEHMETLQVKDFNHISDAFRVFMRGRDIGEGTHACVAFAGPIEGDQVRLTNGDWAFSVEQTRGDLALERLLLINDFKAQAAALPFIPDDHLILLGGGESVVGRPKLVIGPGTGLGVAATVPGPAGHTIIESEGGHIGLSPSTSREMAVHHVLIEKFGRVSAERILCGAGLRNLYAALHTIDGRHLVERTEAEIVSGALDEGSALCVETLDMFFAYLGTVAGDLALAFGSLGGVYIAGGIIPRVYESLATSAFRARFEAKGRLAPMLKNIPTYLVMSEHAGLIGASACLSESTNGGAENKSNR